MLIVEGQPGTFCHAKAVIALDDLLGLIVDAAITYKYTEATMGQVFPVVRRQTVLRVGQAKSVTGTAPGCAFNDHAA